MSHFYAGIQGNRGRATRQGTAKSGIEGHIRGWGVGVLVHCYVNSDGEDECRVSLTGGSGSYKPSKVIGTFTEKDLEQ